MPSPQFDDSESFVNLETLLVQLSPKEAVVAASTGGGESSTSAETENFHRVLQRMNLLTTERKKADFAAKDLPQDLPRILKKGKAKGQGIFDFLAILSLDL